MWLLRAADRKPAPWRNGGGATTEVAAGGAGDDWRISIATIAQPGPFSVFAGMTRTLAVLSGEGVVLTGPQVGRQQLGSDGASLRFSGAEPITAELVGGSTQDLNIMTRDGAFDHDLRAIEPGSTTLDPIGAICFVLAAKGPISCSDETKTVVLSPFDALALGTGPINVAVPHRAFAFFISICDSGQNAV